MTKEQEQNVEEEFDFGIRPITLRDLFPDKDGLFGDW